MTISRPSGGRGATCLRSTAAFAICLQLLGFSPPVQAGGAVSTFEADFLRTATGPSGREEQTGRLSFDASRGRLLLELRKPIHQWAVLQGNEIVLYYPEAGEALRIASEAQAVLPFFSVLWNCFKEDFGLSAQGYRMARYEKAGSRLISTWTPPSQLAKIAGEAILEHDGPRLLRVEHKTAKGNLRSRAVLAQHTAAAGTSFPLEAVLSFGSREGVTEETVILRNPKFNVPLSETMKSFAVPPGVNIKDVR